MALKEVENFLGHKTLGFAITYLRRSGLVIASQGMDDSLNYCDWNNASASVQLAS
jgi:hypothetical protein